MKLFNKFYLSAILSFMIGSCGSYKALPEAQIGKDFSNLSTTIKPKDKIKIKLNNGDIIKMRFKEMGIDSITRTFSRSGNASGKGPIMIHDIQSILLWHRDPAMTGLLIVSLAIGGAVIVIAIPKGGPSGGFGPL
ncbi:hypothetical protein BH10BAC4_BH10BAC4_16510 [soil metagenome]